MMDLEILEKRLPLMVVGILLVISLGGLAEIVPLMASPVMQEPVEGMQPLTALQLEGRDLYIREGCVGCHSQMIRPLRAETERYGHYSVAGEFVWDHPFLWGSKRTGPDLARVGGRYSDDWHRQHLIDPRSVVPESNMPGFPWLVDATLDGEDTAAKMRALRAVGVPYRDEDIEGAAAAVAGKSELTAMLAYLQQLGTHLKARR
ncbi:MAG: cytochrome-c oxidase, cbb3-type subunit II [Deltaproteobacteria bacterium]|nr:cytochrome-c oxidase, cbb3-type subunit II [Deltaproteobacteria bacterium]MBW2387397.1 cytochrome-c oxidase, cbb3-type subunit II [Deltaproteobacteria bacterium]MBW2724653.1 cytochrome-c oxidase, cbb3-type subunit II [Deltaproteobacteria bacterium]